MKIIYLGLAASLISFNAFAGQIRNMKPVVEGKITRITPFGAFVQLSPSVEALVHVSEMSDDETVDPQQIFKLNEKKQFKVLDIDTEARKIALSLKSANKK